MTARVQRDMDTRTTHHYLSIASGIGGLDLGVELGSGGSALPVCYVEIEATASAILASRMEEGALPPGPIWDDLHTFDGSAWRGLVDGIVGGYPCQPFSVAGKHRGFDDERNLWPAIEGLIESVGPKWCFFENVENHLRVGYFDAVKPGLEALGYRVEAQLCAASDVGATHQRKRLFILAVENANQSRAMEGQAGHEPAWWATGSLGRRVFPPAPREHGAWREILDQRPELSPATQREIHGMVDGPPRGLGITRTEQLRLLGNGVVPQQAALAWRLLWREMEEVDD